MALQTQLSDYLNSIEINNDVKSSSDLPIIRIFENLKYICKNNKSNDNQEINLNRTINNVQINIKVESYNNSFILTCQIIIFDYNGNIIDTYLDTYNYSFLYNDSFLQFELTEYLNSIYLGDIKDSEDLPYIEIIDSIINVCKSNHSNRENNFNVERTIPFEEGTLHIEIAFEQFKGGNYNVDIYMTTFDIDNNIIDSTIEGFRYPTENEELLKTDITDYLESLNFDNIRNPNEIPISNIFQIVKDICIYYSTRHEDYIQMEKIVNFDGGFVWFDINVKEEVSFFVLNFKVTIYDNQGNVLDEVTKEYGN